MASTAITPTHLAHDTFANKVLEEKLETVEANGYIYARGKGTEKDVLFRTYGPKWSYLFQVKRVLTQDNVAGGALAMRFSIPAGMTARLVSFKHEGPVSNVANYVAILDEDATECNRFGAVTAASVVMNGPNQGASATSSSNLAFSPGMILGPGQYLRFSTAGAAQTETLTVSLTLLLPITATATSITVDTTGSAGTPNLANSTISDANTLQAVLLP